MFIKQKEIKPIDFDNLKIIDYTAGSDFSSSFAEITIPAGISHKFSWSKRSDKYYYIVQGRVLFTIDGEQNILSSGDVCVIPKGARFNYSNNGPEIAKLILVHTPGFKLEFEVFE
jgi:mannose-6-phosphate isomerase-like protein (cupin superfamily)